MRLKEISAVALHQYSTTKWIFHVKHLQLSPPCSQNPLRESGLSCSHYICRTQLASDRGEQRCDWSEEPRLTPGTAERGQSLTS